MEISTRPLPSEVIRETDIGVYTVFSEHGVEVVVLAGRTLWPLTLPQFLFVQTFKYAFFVVLLFDIELPEHHIVMEKSELALGQSVLAQFKNGNFEVLCVF